MFSAMMAIGLSPMESVAIIDRDVSRNGSSWLVRYQLQYLGASPVKITADDITVSYEAWVSNSHCKPHTVARKSRVTFNLARGNRALTTVIANKKESQQCKEYITCSLAMGDQPPPIDVVSETDFLSVTLQPQQIFWLCLSIKHHHFLYGKYDALMGRREISVNFGFAKFSDVLEMNDEHHDSDLLGVLSALPPERLDAAQFHSPPDSLLITIADDSLQDFRFDDMPVRYDTKIKLTFWYLIAYRNSGECRVRLMQYQDGDGACYRLDDLLDENLKISSGWQYFEKILTTGNKTNTVALDFRIIYAKEATFWIDDVSLTPVSQKKTK